MAQAGSPGERPLSERYGRRPTDRRRTGVIMIAVAIVGLGAWAIWAAVGQSQNAISAIVQSFHVTSPHSISVTVQVTRDSSQPVHCVVTALASDHSTVGETTLRVPTGGGGTRTLTTVVKTERPAVSADIGDCYRGAG